MIGHVSTGLAAAMTTLTDHVVLAVIEGDTWDDITDQLTPGGHVVAWEGPGSLGPPAGVTGGRTGADRGADETIQTRTLRLPPDAPVRSGMRAYLNPPRDIVDLAELDGHTCYVVRSVSERTTTVLRRCRVVSLADHRAVPS